MPARIAETRSGGELDLQRMQGQAQGAAGLSRGRQIILQAAGASALRAKNRHRIKTCHAEMRYQVIDFQSLLTVENRTITNAVTAIVIRAGQSRSRRTFLVRTACAMLYNQRSRRGTMRLSETTHALERAGEEAADQAQDERKMSHGSSLTTYDQGRQGRFGRLESLTIHPAVQRCVTTNHTNDTN